MLDQLVESRSNSAENRKRGGYLLTTLLTVFALAFGGILYSLFAHDLAGMGSEDLELSTLVAPVPVPEEAPPPPEPEQKQEKQTTKQEESTLPTRTVNMARTDEPIIPDKPSAAPVAQKARPNSAFQIGDKDQDVSGPPSAAPRTGDGGSQMVPKPTPPPKEEKDDEPPPTPKPTPPPTPKPTPPPPPKTVSGGVVNGKAVSLVKPPYPPAAKAVRASGAVNVQVTIDENGNVISASAVSGHPLLRAAAESAARASKFSPTMLSGQKVKVTGVIVYNFTQ